MQNQIEIFQAENNEIKVEVRFEDDTVWLSQAQMGELFGQTKQNISLHISNCFKEKELDKIRVVKESLTTAIDGKNYKTKFYNLDVIISVGYRVKSNRGTQFRQWATQKLKDFLVKGYAINEYRLSQKNQEIQFLHDGIRIMSRAIEEVTDDDSFKWLNKFSKGLQLLDDYDHEKLDLKGLTTNSVVHPSLVEYDEIVSTMKRDFSSSVFGEKKDEGFSSAISQIEQSFGNTYIYPSVEEKAAMLLYLIIKNHAFVDGNKRIGAACFLLFLKCNNLLFSDQGCMLLSNEALASVTLFVAASKPEEMGMVKSLVISVLNRNKV